MCEGIKLNVGGMGSETLIAFSSRWETSMVGNLVLSAKLFSWIGSGPDKLHITCSYLTSPLLILSIYCF